MKNLFKVLIITACVITGFFPTGCMKPLDYTELLEFKPSVYPSTIDFNISGLGTYICGEEYTIAVTPKPDMTQGNITIFYEGYNYLKSNVPPVSAGAYTVTFNVEKAKGFFAVSGMVAGLLMINNPVYNTPKKEDFAIDGLGPYTLGDTLDVSIKPNPNMTKGHITILYERYDYPISIDKPSSAGAYTVTFNVDVDDAGKFNASYGLFAGTLIINNPDPPKKESFKVDGLPDEGYKFGETIAVTVDPLDNRLKGKVTIYYEGYNHPRSATPPSAAGVYTVTFDVAAVEGYSVAAYGLVAGTLTIYIPVYPTPVVGDFDIIGLGEYLFKSGKTRSVTIEPKPGSSIKGGVTVIYTTISVATPVTTLIPPGAIGVYSVTFDVDASSGNNAEAKGLLAGTVIINENNKLISYSKPENPYHITTDDASSVSEIKDILNNNPNSFFELDLTNINANDFGSTPNYFQGNNKITSVTIDKNINDIGTQTFENCTNLKEVSIEGSGSTIIKYSTFRGCSSIDRIYIGKGVIEISYSAFGNPDDWGYANFKEVTIIGKSSTVIYYSAFINSIIEKVYIENGVITTSAFSGCDIKNLRIGKGVTEISDGAFNSCTLTSVTFDDERTTVLSFSGGNNNPPFPGNLVSAYTAGGPGTYTWNGSTSKWEK